MKIDYCKPLLTITIQEDCTIDTILEYYKQSKKNRYLLYKDEKIRVNQVVCKQNRELSKDDLLQIYIDVKSDEDDMIEPDFSDLSVCYEDDIVLVVNKPSHLLVHSDGVNTAHTLSNRVQGYFMMEGKQNLVRPIHRLDYETSGLVFFCKLPFFQAYFDEMLKEKKIYREYDAICEGIINQKKQTINQPIGKDRHESNKMRISKTGKEAKTQISTIKKYKTYTWVHARLFTGRTHQIRVHMASIHHPLLADSIYGSTSSLISRHALHASSLTFYHPIKQEMIQVTCELPSDMQTLLK